MLCNASWYTPHIPRWGYGVCIMLCSVMLCYIMVWCIQSNKRNTMFWITDNDPFWTIYGPDLGVGSDKWAIWTVLAASLNRVRALTLTRSGFRGSRNALFRTKRPRFGTFLFYARAYIYRVVYPVLKEVQKEPYSGYTPYPDPLHIGTHGEQRSSIIGYRVCSTCRTLVQSILRNILRNVLHIVCIMYTTSCASTHTWYPTTSLTA